MKILVAGSGGREHALVWKLKQSPRAAEIFCAPGNGGICDEAQCLPWDGKDIDALLEQALRIRPELTVIGPELPLSMGVVDLFRQKGLAIFGPTQAAAQLESSKGFAKEFMQRHRIPTAHYAVARDRSELRHALPHFHGKIVVKADGLAAGKGVVIAEDRQQAEKIAGEMMTGSVLGGAGRTVVLEEFLEGDELSFLVMTDGDRVAPLAAARDHKRVGEGDTGENTGGMGAYSADKLIDDEMQQWLLHHIVQPTIDGMREEGMPYQGILYCGLMMTARGPEVLEFNCRLGDPETQAVLMRLDSDLVEAFEACIEGRVSDGDFRWSTEPSACVVLASGGYPGTIEVGKKISGLDEALRVPGVKVFHAGTAKRDGEYFTSAGRVLGVTARGADLKSAVQRAYSAAEKISFEGMQYRRDIAAKAVEG